MKAERRQIKGRPVGRMILAFIVSAPVALAVALIIYYGIVALIAGDRYMPSLPYVALGSLLWGAVAGWPATLVLGLPGHIWLYRRGARKFADYLVAGVIGGGIATALFGVFAAFYIPAKLAAMVATAISLLYFGLASIGACGLFWLIRRPDRDIAQTVDLVDVFS